MNYHNIQLLPRKPAQAIGAASARAVYSIEIVGDVPVPGGYAAVAYDLGPASSGARLRRIVSVIAVLHEERTMTDLNRAG